MYTSFYGFTGMPFQLTPDSRFFFGSRGHSRAIAHLVYGLAQEEGFVVVTGEVGAGKTTLVERLWSQLDRNSYAIGRVLRTQVSGDELLRLAAGAFGVDNTLEKTLLLRRFEDMLRANRAAGRRNVLVVDEAQGLSVPALEELRMLSNMSENGRALMQTILLGQPQFRLTLARPDLDQLRQRVLASYHLGPLAEAETQAYIEHRLHAVGWKGNPRFEPGAFAAVHRHTGGIPRRINRLCSRVLLLGSLEETTIITEAMIENTAAELHRDLAAPDLPEVAGDDALLGTPTEPGGQDMARRLRELEQRLALREKVFERLGELFGTQAGQPR